MVVAVVDPLRNRESGVALPKTQKAPGEHEKCGENPQRTRDSEVQVSREAVGIHEARIDNEGRRRGDRGRQRDPHHVGAHILVADREAFNAAGAAHSHDGKAIHEERVGAGHQVLEDVWGHGLWSRCCYGGAGYSTSVERSSHAFRADRSCAATANTQQLLKKNNG